MVYGNMICRTVIVVSFLLGAFPSVLAAESNDGTSKTTLTWHRYEKAVKLARDQNKFVLIDFYTDWCSWCKVMDEKTYTDPDVKRLIEESFILVKVNAESKRLIKLQGRKVTETQLASIYRVRSYPTTFFLQPDGKAIAPVSGYVAPDEFEPILRYIAESHYKEMPFDQYKQRIMK